MRIALNVMRTLCAVTLALQPLAVEASTTGITLKDIVKVIGTPRPEFSVKLDKGDLDRLAESFRNLERLAPTEIDINDLFMPGDEEAIAQAASGLAHRLTDSAHEIVNLKAIIYRLAALSTLPDFRDHEGSLYSAYQEKLQNSYRAALDPLLFVSASMQNAIKACRSELCVATIANAQIELMQFGNGLNNGLDLSALDKTHFSFEFKNKFLKGILSATIETLWDGINPSNEETSVYGILLAGALTPIVAAGAEVIDVGQAIAGVLSGPSITSLKISVRGIDYSLSDETDAFRSFVARKLFSLINGIPFENMPAKPMKRHRMILTCESDSGSGAAVHVIVVGMTNLQCAYKDKKGHQWDYNLVLKKIGPGFDMAFGEMAIVTILSPVAITPEGKWWGVDASAGFLIGAELGIFVGKGGSVALFTGLRGIALWASAGIGVMELAPR